MVLQVLSIYRSPVLNHAFGTQHKRKELTEPAGQLHRTMARNPYVIDLWKPFGNKLLPNEAAYI